MKFKIHQKLQQQKQQKTHLKIYFTTKKKLNSNNIYILFNIINKC